MGRAIGIDLGTTNTVVAVLHEGRPQVVEDDKGYRVLPSVVSLDDFGTATVGHAARNKILTDPDRTVYAFKRLMGRRFDSDQAAEARKRVGYDIEQSADGLCTLRLGQQLLSPIEVSALVLQTAKEMAERALGETVDEAVITVPAYFNHQQRSATFEAAKVAGLRCERLLNEPTAAALAYGFRRDSDRTIVIYDLGGGTFDVSVLHLSGGVYEILATKGDTYLGGEDFDYRLVDYLADHFQTQTGFDLREDRTALQRIKDAAERAKCELSFTDRTTVLVPRLTPEHNLELAVTRLTLESLVEDLVERTLDVTRRALSDAGLQLNDIDDVILVGGQTRMPRVREAISGLFGKEPSRGVHPEEVVAIGAAVHAASLTDQEDAPQHVLIDVTPFDLGIDVIGGLFQAIIPRNTHVPTSETRAFATSQDDQEAVRVTVRQGDSRFADENEFLGEFIMSGLTPAPRMQTKVEVTFRIDSNGMLHASAVEPGTGESRRITIRNYGEVAQSKGAIKPSIESDGKPDVMVAPGQSKAAKVGAPADAGPAAGGGKSKRGGFLAGLFGRNKKAAAAGAAAAGAAAAGAAAAGAAASTAETAGADVAAEAGGTPPPPAPSPGISLPEVEPLEAIDEVALEDILPPANIEDDDVMHLGGDALQPVPDRSAPAAVGMAGSARDAWDQGRDESFQMPAFDDEEDDDDVPLGLAGGGFEDSVDEMFALPDGSDDALEELDDGLLELGNEPLGDADDVGALFAPVDDAQAPSEPAPQVEAPQLDDDPFGLAGDGLFDLGDSGETPAAAADAFSEAPAAPGPEPEAVEPEPDPALAVPVEDALSDTSDLFAFDGPPAEPAAPAAPAAEDTAEDPFGDLAGELFGDLDGDVDLGQTDPAQTIPTAEELASPSPGEPDTGELFDFTAPADGSEDGAAFMLPPPDTAEVPPLDETDEIFGLPGTVDDPAEVFGLPGLVEGEDAGGAAPDEPDPSDLFAGAPDLPPRHSENDDERTEIFARSPGPTARGGETRKKKRRRKPARLKLAYRRVDAMVTEYRENLRRGGCFVKTSKPLPVGRECVIEVRAPGMEHPLALQGVVTWSSVGLSSLPDGQDPGMGIEYRLDDERRIEIEQVLASLGA